MKRTISLILTLSLLLSSMLSLFSFTASADILNYVKKWNVSEEMLSVMKECNGAEANFDNTPFEFIPRYYSLTGIKSVSYNPSGTSYFRGNVDAGGEHYKSNLSATTADKGLSISSASDSDMKITFTAPCSGEYVFSPEAIGGSVGKSSIYSSNGEYDVTVKLNDTVLQKEVVSAGASSDFEEQNLELLKGDVISFVFNAPGWKQGGYIIHFNFSFTLLEEKINTIVVSEPVYETTEYNVAEELLNNTGSWPTAYQNPSSFSYNGKLVPVYVGLDGSYGNAFCKTSTTMDIFSNTNQNYENHTLKAGTDNSLNWVYDYGSYKMGFKFTADLTTTMTLSSDLFSGTGINLYIYELSSGALKQIGSPVSVSADEGLNVSFDVYEGETYYVVLGKSSAAYNQKRNCKTSFMKLSYTELISPAVYEDTDYIFQKNAEYYIKNAEYLIQEDDFLTVTIGATTAYSYAVWVQQYMDGALRWIPLEEIDEGMYALMNAYATDGMFRFCTIAYDSYGVPITTTYFNKITEVSPEQSGAAVIENVFVNGNPVNDTVVIDKAEGDFTLEYSGVNIASATYAFGGVRANFTDSVVISPLQTGKMYITLDVYSSVENGLSSHKVITAYVYDSESVEDYKDISSLDVSVDEAAGNIDVSASGTDDSLYSYMVFSNFSELLYSANNLSQNQYSFLLGNNNYGMFTVKASVKNSVYGGEHDKILKTVNIARPGGTWGINATLDTSSSTTVYGEIGQSYELLADASFSGSLDGEDVEYCFYIKDHEGTRVTLDWSSTNRWSFTPAYSGRYVLGVAVKGSNSKTAEAVKEFYLDVEGEKSSGTVEITTETKGVGLPVLIKADYSEKDYDICNYRFWIITDSYKEIIQNYSVSDTCVWIPKTAGEYEIRVDVINQNSFGIYDVNTVKSVRVK